MSVDVFQEKIRKTKNPSVLYVEALPDLIPPSVEEGDILDRMRIYFTQVLEGLKGVVPAVRFGFGSFALLSSKGLSLLNALMVLARRLGYYVLLDLPELMTPAASSHAAALLLAGDEFDFDGVVAGAYAGSDVIAPLRELCKQGKTVFVVARTANKSAVELQDLLAGGRLVHVAAVDLVARHGDGMIGKCGYSNLGAVAAASSSGSLKALRPKYNRVFLLLDGYDYPNSNAKNCSYAFDSLGHGAAVCAGLSITGAWKENGTDGFAFAEEAVRAVQQIKKNLNRYISIL